MKTLTVITTTYNRAYCLHQLYESLVRQTSRDFCWMIIDDGSTDKTETLVEGWRKEHLVDIEYYYKENGGMHTARNLAYEKVKTEINVIVDSDDWMPNDAVEHIVEFWMNNRSEDVYGIIANNITPDGLMVGTNLPNCISKCTLTELTEKYGVKGDKKLVLRSDLSRLFPFPEFSNEKFFPASYKYLMLDKTHKLIIMNKQICIVDYNDDSMTYNKYYQYKTCAKGFAFYRNIVIANSRSFKTITREMVHYIAESILSRNYRFISTSSKPLFAIVCILPGYAYYFYLTTTKRKY